MEYRELAPPPVLTPFVAAFWTLRGAAPAPSVELVLPDGCAEIVVHRTGRFREWHASGGVQEQPAAIVAGVMDRAVALSPADSFETIGVRLMPYGLARLSAHPLDAIGRQLASAEAVLSPAVTRLLSTVGQADSLEDAVRILRHGLSEVFARAQPPPASVIAAVRRIRHTAGAIQMDRLARETGVTGRALERFFDLWVGLSPKRYARIVRFHRAVAALVSAPDLPGAAVAVEYGYYDQAHLTRDFKAFTGSAPRALLTGRLGALTRHFVTGSVSVSSKPPAAGSGDSGAPGGSP